MSIITNHEEFMSGIYVVEFRTNIKAEEFVKQYSNCPIWCIVSKGLAENQVFIMSIELIRQCHGNFSQDENTLVKNPNLIGAKSVTFRRDDTLLELFNNYTLKTGYSQTIPCGSNCNTCDSFKKPCQGCPTCFKY